MKSRLLSILLTGIGLAIGMMIIMQIAQSLRGQPTGLETPEASLPADLNRTVAPVIFKTISEQNGMLRLSGTSEPEAVITVRNQGENLRQIKAGKDGNWSALIAVKDVDIWALDLMAFVQGNTAIRSDETVYRILPKALEADEEGGETEGSIKNLSALIMVTAPGGPSRIVQSPFGGQPMSGGLSLGPLDYDLSGSVIFSGSSSVNGVVRIYVNNEIVGQRPVSANERWYSIAAEALPTGQYNIRAELQDESGETSAVIVPFVRTVTEPDAPSVVVAYSADVWQVSRLIHGGGRQVTAIFASPPVLEGEP